MVKTSECSVLFHSAFPYFGHALHQMQLTIEDRERERVGVGVNIVRENIAIVIPLQLWK